MKVMLNTNVYGRPFDKLTSKEIIEEAAAAFEIFSFACSGKFEIITSDVLFSEVKMIKDKLKRKFILYLIRYVSDKRARLSSETIKMADILNILIKDYMDSLHVAFAAVSACNYLITCDKDLLKAAERIENLLSQNGFKLEITYPTKFVNRL